MLLDEVRSSLDYYRNQPTGSRLLRVVVTGGASQLPGLPERLATLVGLPVEAASPRLQLAIGDIRFPESEYPRLDPYLPAAVGLALGGAGIGTVVDLAPRARRKVKERAGVQASNVLKPVAAIAAGLIVLLGIPTFLAHQSIADKKHERASIEQHNEKLQSSIDSRPTSRPPRTRSTRSARRSQRSEERRLVEPHAAGDLKTMPANVWLTSFRARSPPRAGRRRARAADTSSSGSAEASSDAAGPGRPRRFARPGHVRGEEHLVRRHRRVAQDRPATEDLPHSPGSVGDERDRDRGNRHRTDCRLRLCRRVDRRGAQQPVDEVPRRSPMTAGGSA